jgi:hypothetical protein
MMWARIVEILLGCWLALSPFIFHYGAGQKAYWVNDLLCGLAVTVLALASFRQAFRHAHLLTGVVACWLIGFGYWGVSHPAPLASQNDLLAGLLLLMLAIIPNEAFLPPGSWRDYFSKRMSLPFRGHKEQQSVK